jgi:hypothetical protein
VDENASLRRNLAPTGMPTLFAGVVIRGERPLMKKTVSFRERLENGNQKRRVYGSVISTPVVWRGVTHT